MTILHSSSVLRIWCYLYAVALLGVLGSIVGTVPGHEIGMTFVKHKAKRLDGCVYKTANNIPLTLLCTQVSSTQK